MDAPTLGKEAKQFLPKSRGFICTQHVLLKAHLGFTLISIFKHHLGPAQHQIGFPCLSMLVAYPLRVTSLKG